MKSDVFLNYNFKRDFYFEIDNLLIRSNTLFLLGPRKCGKTVALLQFSKEHTNSKYINFKTISKDNSMNVFSEIERSIEENKDIIYLLDEITYAYHPELEINKIALKLSEVLHSSTKIVFTGSQSIALESWANRAFCGNSILLKVDFLSYKEWLRYKNIEEVSESTYLKFVLEVDQFYKFTTLQNYLEGCLEETIISNNNTDNMIVDNDVQYIDSEILLDICYSTLFTLHNHVSSKKFASDNKLHDTIRYYFRDIYHNKNYDEEIQNDISSSFIGKYSRFKSKDINTIKQAFKFLKRAGLITITPISNSLENVPNINKDLSDYGINVKDVLFSNYNFCIKYPMFYISILKDVLKGKMPLNLPTALLGSIVECHIRGMLNDNGSFEFQDDVGHEIDYISIHDHLALEITISNKRSNELNFKFFPDITDYQKILLSKNESKKEGNLLIVPYYQFIYNL